MDTGTVEQLDAEAPFRYDDAKHEYIDARTGEVLPHITGMLEAAGLVDTTWFTEEGRRRGTAVHQLTLDYDIGVLELNDCRSEFKGYLAAYDEAIRTVRPTWLHLEERFVHPRLRFGGCPDRAGLVYKRKAVVEIKTGGYEKSHQVQLALQAILVATRLNIPPEHVERFAFYLEANGKWKLEHLIDSAAMPKARSILRKCCAV